MSGPAPTCSHGKEFGKACADCRRLGSAIAATKINPHVPLTSVEMAHYGFPLIW
jgi:hypothetical protein